MPLEESENWVIWIVECVWRCAFRKKVIEDCDRSNQITVTFVQYRGFDAQLQNDKGARESKVMHNQSVPLQRQLEESSGETETKEYSQDFYKLLHLPAVTREKKICGANVISVR